MKPSSYSPGTFNKSAVIVGSARPKPPRFVLQGRHVLGGAMAVLATVVLFIFGYEPAYKGTLVVGVPRPLILAEPSFESGTPTSFQAVDRALQLGLDGAELIAELTPSGELVIVRNGAVLGTFERLVRSVKGRGIFLVQLQTGPAGIERAVEVLRRYDAHLSVVLSSFNPFVLYRIKQLDPFVRTAFIFADHRPADMTSPSWVLRQEFVRRGIRKFVPVDMLSANEQVDQDVTDRLIAKGWPTFIWGPASKAQIRMALTKKPYGIISNNPVLARQVRGE